MVAAYSHRLWACQLDTEPHLKQPRLDIAHRRADFSGATAWRCHSLALALHLADRHHRLWFMAYIEPPPSQHGR